MTSLISLRVENSIESSLGLEEFFELCLRLSSQSPLPPSDDVAGSRGKSSSFFNE